MPISHKQVNGKPTGPDPTRTNSQNWNDSHYQTLGSLSYTANGAIPGLNRDVNAINPEVIEATNTITLTVDAAGGSGQVLYFLNLGAGVITIVDANSKTIGGQASWKLVNQYQYVKIQASPVTGNWNVIGGN